MAARTEYIPTHLIRLFMAPAAVGTFLLTLFAALRRRAAKPSMPRMSDEWLRSHGDPEWDTWR
jgi:hypothetical protein